MFFVGITLATLFHCPDADAISGDRGTLVEPCLARHLANTGKRIKLIRPPFRKFGQLSRDEKQTGAAIARIR